jgi:hypothetical protein
VAQVHVTVTRDFAQPAAVVFAELIDWRGHARWVPLTRVRVESGDCGPGTVFVATTGVGPVALPDRMRVDELDAEAMTVRITKVGPVLSGLVDLSVTSTGATTSRVRWVEDVRVPGLPRGLARPVAAATERGFRRSLAHLAARLSRRGHGSLPTSDEA